MGFVKSWLRAGLKLKSRASVICDSDPDCANLRPEFGGEGRGKGKEEGGRGKGEGGRGKGEGGRGKGEGGRGKGEGGRGTTRPTSVSVTGRCLYRSKAIGHYQSESEAGCESIPQWCLGSFGGTGFERGQANIPRQCNIAVYLASQTAIILPILTTLLIYFFWKGWETRAYCFHFQSPTSICSSHKQISARRARLTIMWH